MKITAARAGQRTIIEPSSGRIMPDFSELWAFRELMFLMAWRDVKVRYQHTMLGVGWVVLQPILMMLIFTLLFSKLGKLPAGEAYPILALAGYAAWQYFQRCVYESAGSFHVHRNLLTKVYFARIIVPVVTCLPGLIDLAIGIALVFLIVLITQHHFGAQVLLLPLFILSHFLLTLGVTTWSSALCIEFKDFRHVIPFALQFGLFLSPVAYSILLIPEKWRLVYAINPLVGSIEAIRWCFTPTTFPTMEFAISLILTLIILISGLVYFQSIERKLSDMV